MRSRRHDVAQYDVFDSSGKFMVVVSFQYGTLCKDVKFSLHRYYGYDKNIKVLKHKENV